MIVNPLTNRKIRIGGEAYKRLLKEGYIENTVEDHESVLDNAWSDEDSDIIEKRKKKLNKRLPVNKQAVRGRGIKKSKLVVRTVPLLNQQTAKRMKKQRKNVSDDDIFNMIVSEFENIQVSEDSGFDDTDEDTYEAQPIYEKPKKQSFVKKNVKYELEESSQEEPCDERSEEPCDERSEEPCDERSEEPCDERSEEESDKSESEDESEILYY